MGASSTQAPGCATKTFMTRSSSMKPSWRLQSLLKGSMLQKLVGETDDQDRSHLFGYLEGPHCFAAATSFVFDCQLWTPAVGLFFGLAGTGDHDRWSCDCGLGLAESVPLQRRALQPCYLWCGGYPNDQMESFCCKTSREYFPGEADQKPS
jgi:hypothetical protein